VRNNEKADFFKRLSHDDGLSLWKKTTHCPDCFNKGCTFVREYLNRFSRIDPEHYSNYNQYYGDNKNANPIETNKKIRSFHECQPYCKVRVEEVGTPLPLCRQYFEMNHWIPTLELEKVLIPLPDQVILFAVATGRKSNLLVTGIDRFPVNVAFDLSPNGLAQWYNRLYLFLWQEREMHIEFINAILNGIRVLCPPDYLPLYDTCWSTDVLILPLWIRGRLYCRIGQSTTYFGDDMNCGPFSAFGDLAQHTCDSLLRSLINEHYYLLNYLTH
jgi:hypothetical protein